VITDDAASYRSYFSMECKDVMKEETVVELEIRGSKE